jgi:hypothetical protein
MAPKQKPQQTPDLEDTVAPEVIENIPATGGYRPSEDGGNADHPIHDEDEEDKMPEDYEREIDKVGSVD